MVTARLVLAEELVPDAAVGAARDYASNWLVSVSHLHSCRILHGWKYIQRNLMASSGSYISQ